MGNRYIKINSIKDKIPASKVDINLDDFDLPIKKGTGENSCVQNGGGNIASGELSFAEGYYTKALGKIAHAEGNNTYALGVSSHSEGTGSIAKTRASHAEGDSTNALGESSHAEGKGIKKYSHFKVTGEANATTYTTSSEHQLKIGQIVMYNDVYRKVISIPSTTSFTVNNTLSSYGLNNLYIYIISGIAYGDYSHTEGECTIASDKAAHAEGAYTKALEYYSHAEGSFTEALNQNEHAEGSGNLSIKNKTIHTVGIGDPFNHRNAHEIHSDGKHYIYGIGGYDGTNSQTEGVKSVQRVITDLETKNTELTSTIASLETRIAALESIISQKVLQE